MATSKKGKIFLIAGGLFALILLISIAAWLTGHMMVLSKGVNQLIGSDNQQKERFVATAAVVVKKNIPPESKPISDEPEKPTVISATKTPQVATVTNTVEESKTTRMPESEASVTTQSTMETTTTTIPQPIADTTEAEPKENTTAASSPEPLKMEASASEETQPDKKFIYEIQVGAFLMKENAVERIIILKELGYEPYMFRAADRSHRLWHTIRVGKYETFEEAQRALSLYKARSNYPAAITLWNSLLPPKMNK